MGYGPVGMVPNATHKYFGQENTEIQVGGLTQGSAAKNVLVSSNDKDKYSKCYPGDPPGMEVLRPATFDAIEKLAPSWLPTGIAYLSNSGRAQAVVPSMHAYYEVILEKDQYIALGGDANRKIKFARQTELRMNCIGVLTGTPVKGERLPSWGEMISVVGGEPVTFFGRKKNVVEGTIAKNQIIGGIPCQGGTHFKREDTLKGHLLTEFTLSKDFAIPIDPQDGKLKEEKIVLPRGSYVRRGPWGMLFEVRLPNKTSYQKIGKDIDSDALKSLVGKYQEERQQWMNILGENKR